MFKLLKIDRGPGLSVLSLFLCPSDSEKPRLVMLKESIGFKLVKKRSSPARC